MVTLVQLEPVQHLTSEDSSPVVRPDSSPTAPAPDVAAVPPELDSFVAQPQKTANPHSRWDDLQDIVTNDIGDGTNIKEQQYGKLIRQEKLLQKRLHSLERQVAEFGILAAPAKLELMLAQKREEITRLRIEIGRLEQELALEQHSYNAAKKAQAPQADLAIRQQHIKNLEAEIEHKRQLAEIYQDNVRYLEQQQARYGINVPIHIINEINETHKLLAQLHNEIKEFQKEMPQVTKLWPDSKISTRVAPVPTSDLAPALTDQLRIYSDLRHRERQQLQLTYLLARKYAWYGPLLAPPHLARELAKERQKLAQLQAEIERLTNELTQVQRDYQEAGISQGQGQRVDLSIQQKQIENLAIDLKCKQALARIYTENINYLEQQQAKYGLFEPVNLILEIKETARLCEHTHREIQAQELMLYQEYGISPEWLSGIELLSEHEIGIFVETSLIDRSNNRRKWK